MCVAVAQVTVPCFNIGYTDDEYRVARVGNGFAVLHKRGVCGKGVEFL